MHELFISFLKNVVDLNNLFFSPVDNLINAMPFAGWVIDGVKDSVHLVPFLFIIFLLIEFIEYYYSEKMNSIVKGSKKTGPFLGSLVASVPQCGFSVIASTLYTKRLITRGTLLAVYLSTSDEAIPVLLSEPHKLHIILQILVVKIIIAIIAGYLVDFVSDKALKKPDNKENGDVEEDEGCCHHNLSEPKKSDLIIHPVIHTLNVFFFILIVTLAINFMVMKVGGEENLGQYFLSNSLFQPVIMSLFGLIPNCAVSIAITLMYIKGAIGFGSAIAGLCSSAGLGVLVLFKKNGNLKDTLKIIALLLGISMISGIVIQILYN